MATQYPEGQYLAQVTNQYFGESAEKGTPKFCLVIRIIGNRDCPDSPCRPQKREIVWWITDKTVEWVMRDLRALGYMGETLTGVDPDDEDFHDFRGKNIEVSCIHEEDQEGRLWERWKLSAGPQNLKDKSKLRRLDRILTGQPVSDAKLFAN
jgi:hypothetical protein